MSDKKPENPMAFPQPMVDNQGRIDFAQDYGNGGMCLRDWFAGLAMQSVFGRIALDQNVEDLMLKSGIKAEDFCQFAAMLSYDVADAMLAQREKSK